MKLNEIKVYRMTHIENIPHILEHGITHKDSKNCNPNFKNIGDLSLIGNRGEKIVVVDNGDYGNSNSYNITLGDFIPFYFGVRMPMLYVAQLGGNFVERATSPEDIVYMACLVKEIIKEDRLYYFADGHATDKFTTFYDRSRIKDLPTLVDWNAVRAKYWGGDGNLNVKRQKQAEFLVLNDIKSSCIRAFACYNEKAQKRLIEMGILKERISIIPKAYYEIEL